MECKRIFVHKNEHKMLMKLRPAFKHDEITSSLSQPVFFLVSISKQVNPLSQFFLQFSNNQKLFWQSIKNENEYVCLQFNKAVLPNAVYARISILFKN